jgi:hypothetical protein
MPHRTECTGRSSAQRGFNNARTNHSRIDQPGIDESGLDKSRLDKSRLDKSQRAGSQSRQHEWSHAGKSVADKSWNAVCRYSVPSARFAARKRNSAFDVETNYIKISVN